MLVACGGGPGHSLEHAGRNTKTWCRVGIGFDEGPRLYSSSGRG